MRIVVVLQSREEDCNVQKHPRGWTALPHLWRGMGHDVLVTYRSDLVHPWRLVWRVRRFNPDVVVSVWLAATIVVLLRRVGVFNCPVVHAWDDYYEEQSSLPRRLVRVMERLSVRWADFVTSQSRYNVCRAQAMGVPARYVPYGSDPMASERPAGMPKLSGNFIVVYAGDQSAYKRTSELVSAVRGIDCDLYLFGHANEILMRGAPANAHFMGVVPQGWLPHIYDQAHVLAQTADQDSTFKVFEYIRAGKVVLAPKGRMACFLKHYENAYLVDDFAVGLNELRQNAELRERLGMNLRRIPAYSWPEVAQIYFDVLQLFLEKGREAGSPEMGDGQYLAWLRRTDASRN